MHENIAGGGGPSCVPRATGWIMAGPLFQSWRCAASQTLGLAPNRPPARKHPGCAQEFVNPTTHSVLIIGTSPIIVGSKRSQVVEGKFFEGVVIQKTRQNHFMVEPKTFCNKSLVRAAGLARMLFSSSATILK